MYDKTKKDCPRGFEYCDKKKECVPERTDVSDKLVLKYERYFFKEDIKMDKLKNAEQLTDLALDESFEIFGKTVKAEKKVDRILDAIEEDWKSTAAGIGKTVGAGIAVSGALAGAGAAAKRISGKGVCLDKFQKGTPGYRRCMHKMVHGESKKPEEVDLGKGTINTTGRPYDHPIKTRVVADVEECGMMGGGPLNKGMSDGDVDMDSNDQGFNAEKDQAPERSDNPRKKSNDINQVPNQNAKALYQSIRRQMSEINMMSEGDKSKYKEYFDSMMKKFGVSSPNELDNEKKKAFFNAVDKGWKSTTESVIKEESLLAVILKYGQKTSQNYNACMTKAKNEKWFSKNRSLAVAICKQQDYLGNAAGLKKHIGLCDKGKTPETCRKQVTTMAAGMMQKAKKQDAKIAKLKAKMK